eukprot:CAMPEP_0184339058 /NCGR_PEP_ID=MMETSP1089-20130417/7738_1 /TAXON_ID=38269 ORGANISM="Gloeochaete wittrockiana, Strain SAG46.84" /NCGR_SAMPLE_ID=MMETSP1089 /ASSEMBLY_ACC=CAM_ASM_000445 /LENGTH=205 /DNA_ID=CAMNT_0026666097 /DNA_START=39 /DNA_END=656 /DNA_ORIENTATION=-
MDLLGFIPSPKWCHARAKISPFSTVYCSQERPQADTTDASPKSRRHFINSAAAFIATAASSLNLNNSAFAAFDSVRGIGGAELPESLDDGAGRIITGTIKLAQPASGVSSDSALYVIGRRIGVENGPPVAVKKYSPPFKFPLDFSLGPDDLLQGGAFPPEVDIIVRLDTDGDPFTKSPSDMVGFSENPVEGGTEGLAIKLAPLRL